MLEFIGKLFNFNQDEKNYLYNIGVEKFQIGDYESAYKYYTLLIMIDPQNSLYLKALAGVLHSQKKFQEAIIRYEECYHLADKLDNIDSLYYIADCYINLGEKDLAKQFLEQFLDEINNNSYLQQKYERLIKRAKLIVKGIINEQNRTK